MMKVSSEEVLGVIYECIDEINLMIPDEEKLIKDINTILVGDNNTLDSLSLINFLVKLEEELLSKLSIQKFLLDENILADPRGPYQSIKHLLEWILSDPNS